MCTVHVNTAGTLSYLQQPGFDQDQIPKQPPQTSDHQTASVHRAGLRPYCSETTSETFLFAACQESLWFQSPSITTPDIVRFRAHNLQWDLFKALKPCGANGLTAISNQLRNWFPSLHGQQRSTSMCPPGLTDAGGVSCITCTRWRMGCEAIETLWKSRWTGCDFFHLEFSLMVEDGLWKIRFIQWNTSMNIYLDL